MLLFHGVNHLPGKEMIMFARTLFFGMQRLGLFFCLGVMCWCAPSLVQAEDAPASQRFQVQIGSAKNLDGTKWFAAKASRILNEGTYIVQGGGYYIVLTGYFPKKEQAQNRLMQVRQHYNGMVVSYEIDAVIAGYEGGILVPEQEFLDRLTSGERKRAAREKLRETSPIREVQRDEASGLRENVIQGLRNVSIEGCTLLASEELAGFDFRTTVELADLDPYSLHTVQKHGDNTYFVIEARGGLDKVVTQQLASGKVDFTRKDPAISLKPTTSDEAKLEKLGTSLQELITFCAK